MKNVSLIHTLSALVVALALIGGYLWVFAGIQKMEEQALALSSEIAVKTSEQERASDTRAALEALVQDESNVRAHFVPTESIVPFLESLETLGSELGADVTVVSVSDPDDTGTITLSLSISGSFEAVMRVAGRIEYGPVASATKTLTLDAGDDGVWNAAATLAILTTRQP